MASDIQAETLQQLSPCDVAALQKCLKENKGDRQKCLEEITAFQRACSKGKPGPKAAQPAPQQQ
ncbi:hypothetical protein CHLNCDRAFT_136927 [Chlorella variabilis]|uniref:CHCH domain-containing protein n=1 Tax=Chlorella variabilis TaxID=554065 RepID=E1ZLL4_CHLVA|nr:hypothetical protein CHLNCDRAFT_136927 [Chlorella variabilis]EFN53153.1 hypothetical protein CHLNCDRAFT_136927 [Chlorella variabilis]|eukprot:XP_005845255.1 hypothetical protein CHLNCDRAFT_136927 [Chlorella variabilis]